MNPLAITAAPVQGGVSEFTAPCAFDPIHTFLSFNFYNNFLFLMARDGVTNTLIKQHLSTTSSKPVLTPGRTPSNSRPLIFSPGGTLVENSKSFFTKFGSNKASLIDP